MAPGSLAPQQSYRDLQPGETLTVITPLRKSSGDSDWRYGMPNTSTSVAAESQAINVTISLEAETQFGFERSQYAVRGDGLTWIESMRNLNGTETTAPRPLLSLFPKPAGRQFVRILFLTRASDLNYNTAIIGARDNKRLSELTQAIRERPEAACRVAAGSWCVWIPPGVAAR